MYTMIALVFLGFIGVITFFLGERGGYDSVDFRFHQGDS